MSQVLYLLGKEKDAEALIQESIKILEVHDYAAQLVPVLNFQQLFYLIYFFRSHVFFDYTGKWHGGLNYLH